MNPSHHEPGNNVVSRNRLGRSGRFPIVAISSERVPPRSKRSQERVPEQDFLGNVSQVSEHVGCIARPAGGVIESPRYARARTRRSVVTAPHRGDSPSTSSNRLVRRPDTDDEFHRQRRVPAFSKGVTTEPIEQLT